MSQENENHLFCSRCGKDILNEENVYIHDEDEGDLTLFLCPTCAIKFKKERKDFVAKFKGLETFEAAAKLILKGVEQLGFVLDEDNFKDTPKRFARAYMEIFDGCADRERKIQDILKTAFPSISDSMIVETGITVFSMCPHHLLPVEYKVCVGYIPGANRRVLGISKLTRLVELLAKQPALQEDFSKEIVNELDNLGMKGVAVLVEGQHMCMRMRGVKNPTGVVSTASLSGAFKTSASAREEWYMLIKDRPRF